jgi:hypothetical protein
MTWEVLQNQTRFTRSTAPLPFSDRSVTIVPERIDAEPQSH